MKIKTFQTSVNSLNGIITYLFNSYKENYETYVSAKASSTDYASGWRDDAPIIPTKTSTARDDNWASCNAEKSNYTIFFHKHIIYITKYSLRSQNNQEFDHLKSWVIDGSLDGKKWNLIDKKAIEMTLLVLDI